jgi:murein L,D-transpeptidase YafK
MIHVNCVTIGYIPLTDDKIRELYVLAAEARDGGQTMSPIDIFPSRLTDQNLANLKKRYPTLRLQQFWENLKKGYDTFEKSKQLPQILLDKENKRYTVK